MKHKNQKKEVKGILNSKKQGRKRWPIFDRPAWPTFSPLILAHFLAVVNSVLPTAEEIVIRAVYRALGQRYHPDRFEGDAEEANQKMAEINEAYAVLSDKAKRKQYDSLRGSGIQSGEEFFDESEGDGFNAADPLYDDWQIALEYYPELKELETRLRKISFRLAYTFKVYILDSKLYGKREKIAKELEKEFLKTYFGDNKKILSFACTLIAKGNRDAAKKLNQAVRVLGRDIDVDRVISKIQKDFKIIIPPKIWL